MTMTTKNEVFQKYLPAYLKASKSEKSAILQTVCSVTDMHRKAAIRKFRRLQTKETSSSKRRGRLTIYLPSATAALKTLWELSGEACGELLHPMMSEYLSALQRDKKWEHSEEASSQLLRMSEGTVKAKIRSFQKTYLHLKGKSSTKPSELKEIIPVFTGPWKEKCVGYGQIDTVAHCGISLKGDFVYSLQLVDVKTYWISIRAQWNKGRKITQENLAFIQRTLPFPLLGLHSDSGSEFINWHLKEWCETQGLEQTRSRPYRKNDNAFVEERNGHVIRKHIGYTRLDVFEIVEKMNEFYALLCLYRNHFIASRRCIEKVRIGSKYRKKFERAQTAYRRIMESVDVSDEAKQTLQKHHEGLNPLILKEKLDTMMKDILRMQKDLSKPKS